MVTVWFNRKEVEVYGTTWPFPWCMKKKMKPKEQHKCSTWSSFVAPTHIAFTFLSGSGWSLYISAFSKMPLDFTMIVSRGWRLLSCPHSWPHLTSLLASHRPATLLTLVSSWHRGVNLQRRGHIWLQNPPHQQQQKKSKQTKKLGNPLIKRALHSITTRPVLPFLCWSAAFLSCYFWFCFDTFRTTSQVTRGLLSACWSLLQYMTMQPQQYTGQMSGLSDIHQRHKQF